MELQSDGIKILLALIGPVTALDSSGGPVLDIQVACCATFSVLEAEETRRGVDDQRVVDEKCSRCHSYCGAWRVRVTLYKTLSLPVGRHMLCNPQYSWRMDVRGRSKTSPERSGLPTDAAWG